MTTSSSSSSSSAAAFDFGEAFFTAGAFVAAAFLAGAFFAGAAVAVSVFSAAAFSAAAVFFLTLPRRAGFTAGSSTTLSTAGSSVAALLRGAITRLPNFFTELVHNRCFSA
jgi:hypothetical protein